MPVTVLVGLRPDNGMFTERDRVLALAYQDYEASICEGCGLPASVTHGDHNVDRFEWKDDSICHGCATKASLDSDKNRVTYPGQQIYPVDTRL